MTPSAKDISDAWQAMDSNATKGHILKWAVCCDLARTIFKIMGLKKYDHTVSWRKLLFDSFRKYHD